MDKVAFILNETPTRNYSRLLKHLDLQGHFQNRIQFNDVSWVNMKHGAMAKQKRALTVIIIILINIKWWTLKINTFIGSFFS